MKAIILSLALLLQLTVFAQKTQEEMDKMLKELQENIAIGQKHMKRQADSVLKEIEFQKGQKANINNDETVDDDEEKLVLKLPPKNHKFLSELSKTVLSKTQLVPYIQSLKMQLQQKMEPSKLNTVKSALVSQASDKDLLHENAVSAWYNGAQHEATLLLLEAAQKNTDDGLLLNNLAALLNMGGAAHKAIPFLKNIVVSYPDNSFVLNNLGQSYANLGEADSAMYYLKRCLQIAPMHAMANHTAGVIEAEKGNTTEAEAHFTKAVKASQNQKSVNALKKIKPNASLLQLLKPKISMAPYFNPYKYPLPKLCENVMDSERAEQEFEDFRDQMKSLEEIYSEMATSESASGEKKLRQMGKDIKEIIATEENVYKNTSVASYYGIRPFLVYANRMLLFIQPELVNMWLDAEKFEEEKQLQTKARSAAYLDEIKRIEEAYQESLPKCTNCEGDPEPDPATKQAHCNRMNEAANKCIYDVNEIRKSIQDKYLIAARMWYENQSFWGYLGAPIKEYANSAFYSAVAGYFGRLIHASRNSDYFIKPYCTTLPDIPPAIRKNEVLSKMDCPININISFIAGKIKLDCEKFTFTGGEGVRFKYEKNFESGFSSLGIGIGLGFDVGVGSGIKAGVSGEIAEYLFIGFDKDNNVSDAGLEFTARVSEQVQVKGENIKLSDRPSELKAGYKIGINSGINFTGNVFKMLN